MNKRSKKRIPNLLRKYRKINGLKQKEVAEILGISPTRISLWEKGVQTPSLINILKLSILYRSMIDAFFIPLLRQVKEEIKKKEKEFFDKNKMY